MRGGRQGRNGLLATTALQAAGAAMLLAVPAAAQPAPGAHPMGGSVVAGQAGITQTAAQTTVAQSSQRAAIDWRSFDIGSSHAVVFQQPGTSSITLNRVTGPDPSQIAGRIQANGQVAIVNGSGVVFHAGSQVDVQSLVVSSANVSNANFMAGRMVFDQPGRPDARISNAGSISVKAAGLAALVAPQVANSGTITARMGHVVLAGGEAHTVDLYGDGLMSVDVTRQVQHAPGGATVLVTNSGTVAADGGTIVLTARAADGIMTNLVSNTGRLQANSVGGSPGAITVSALGGSISIAGAVRADGRAPGETGGTVTLAATDTVALASTARVSANGRAGGGTVAVGTTAARALAQGAPGGAGIPAGTSRMVTMAAGARIGASGRGTGSGGTVALLSTSGTTMAGSILARGGRKGGDGGQVEVSARTGLSITGTVDARAPAGRTGTLTIDPDTLVIGNAKDDIPANPVADGAGAPATGTQNITATTFNGFGATVRLTAGDITVGDLSTVIGTAAGSVTLQATGTLLVMGRGIAQPGPLTLIGNTAVNIQAPVSATGATGAMTLNSGRLVYINRTISSSGALTMSSGGDINVQAPVTAAGPLTMTSATNMGNTGAISSSGALTMNSGGSIDVQATMTAAGPLTMTSATSFINVQAPVTATGALTMTSATNMGNTGAISSSGALTMNSGGFIAIHAPVTTPGTLTLIGNTIGQDAGSTSYVTAGTLTGSSVGVTDLSHATLNQVGALGAFTSGGGFLLNNGGNALAITGPLAAPGQIVSLQTGGLTQTAAGTITAGTLTGSSTGDTLLVQPGNAVQQLGPYNANGAFLFTDTPGPGGLIIAGTVRARLAPDSETTPAPQQLTLTVLGPNGSLAIGQPASGDAAPVTGVLDGSAVSLNAAGAITEPAGAVVAATLAGSAASVSLPAATDGTPGQQGNQVTALGGFTATAGGLTLRNSRNLLVTGPVSATGDVAITAQSGAGTPSAAAEQAAGNLTLQGPVASTGGQVTLTAFGALAGPGSVSAPTQVGLFAGGDVRVAGITTGTLTGTAGGVFRASGAFATASSVVATGGDLALTDTVPLTLTGASSAATNAVVAAPSLASTGDLYAGGSIDLQLPGGAFTQSAGTIAAQVKLSVAADTAPGSAASSITQSGGLLAAVGDLVLHSTGDATQTGGELAGQAVRIVSDGGTSSFGATRSATVTFTPGSVALAPGVLPAFTAPAASACLGACVSDSPATPATFRVDAGAISLSNPVSARVVELHSLGSTTQTAAGVITAGSLAGTAGYAQGVGFTYDAPLVQPGRVVLTGANSIASLGPYYAGGDLRLTSTRAMTVTDQVVAGGVDPVPGVGRTIALTAPGIAIDGSDHAGLLQFGTVQGGRFTAAPAAGVLLPGGPATAAAYSTVNLQTDSLRILGAGARVIAPGGLVAIAPLTPGLALSVDASRLDVPGSVMSLAAGDLSLISVLGGAGDAAGPRTLQLGSLTASTGAPAAGSVTINAPLVLTDQAATLGLYSQGAITEGVAGGISIGRPGYGGFGEYYGRPQVIGTITGAAGGGVALGAISDTAPANHFDVLGSFSAGRGLTLSNSPDTNSGQAGLLVQGTVSSGAGDLGLLSVGRVLSGGSDTPSLRLGGTITIGSAATPSVLNAVDGSGAGHTLTLVARDGAANAPAISEAAGSTISTGVLTGRASTADTSATAYDVLLPGTAGTLGATSTNQVATLGGFTVGTGNGVIQAQGAFRLADAGALAVAGPVTAKSVQITANTMTVTGSIGACDVGGGTGDITLGAAGGIAVNSGVIGGQASVALLSDTTVAGGVVNGPAVYIGGRLAITGGQVIGNAVTANGGVTIGVDGSGASATPGTAALQAGSLSSVAGGGIVFNSGTLVSGNDLTVSAAPAISGTIASGGNLQVRNATPSAPALTSSADLLANGQLAVNAYNDFVQTGGSIAAGQGVTVTAGGTINQRAGAAMQAGGTLLLRSYSSGTVNVAGTLSGDPVQVVQTGADLVLAPATLLGRAAVSVGQPRITLSCPGCDNSAPPFGPAPAVSLDVSHVSGAQRPANLRVDGGSIVLGTVAADTVEVHANGSASQAASATLTAGTLTGSAGYGSLGLELATGLPSHATLGLAGTGSLAFTAAGNNVLRLDGVQARSGLALADTPAGQTTSTGAAVAAAGLTIGTTVRAGLATDPLTGTAADATGAPLTITLAGPAGNLAVGGAGAPGAVLAGGTVTLTMPGTLTQAPDALLVAGTLGGVSSSASLAPTIRNQVVRLGTFSAAGDITLLNARDLQVSGAFQAGSTGTLSLGVTGGLDVGAGSLAGGTVALTASGAVTETTGAIRANTLSVNAGSVTAGSTQNGIAVLSGVVAPGGVQLADGQSLATSGAVTAASGPVALQTAGDLTVGAAITAGTTVTLQGTRLTLAPGSTATAGTAMLLNAGSVATLAGQVAAPRLVVTAPQIALQGGTLTVGGAAQAGRTAVGLPTVGGGGNGAFFEAASGLTQTGQTQVLPAAASQATVRIDLTSGAGSVAFAGLVAPSTNLTLNLGGGSASGQVNLNNLSVLYAARSGTATLFGTVGAQGGKQAAGASAIGPSLNPGYRINGCEIGGATCVALDPEAAPIFNPLLTLDLDFFRSGVPVTNPLKELRLNFFRDQDDDRDLLIPDITEQGL